MIRFIDLLETFINEIYYTRTSFSTIKRGKNEKSIEAWLSMLRPGFEPGSQAREARMIDLPTLSEPEEKAGSTFINLLLTIDSPE